MAALPCIHILEAPRGTVRACVVRATATRRWPQRRVPYGGRNESSTQDGYGQKGRGQAIYHSREMTSNEIAGAIGVSQATLYRELTAEGVGRRKA